MSNPQRSIKHDRDAAVEGLRRAALILAERQAMARQATEAVADALCDVQEWRQRVKDLDDLQAMRRKAER